MLQTQRQIAFSHFWKKLPQPATGIWKRTVGREVLELLCGALWHLELSAKIRGGFSTANMQELHAGAHVPWEDWLTQRPALDVQFGGCQLAIHYSLPASFDGRYQSLLQTMSLANGALRLAGARDLLRSTLTNACEPPGILPDVLNDYTSILDSKGNFSRLGVGYSDKEQLLKKVLIVVALRDSFMHGEMPSGTCKRSRKFRRLWINGTLYGKHPKYSPAVIAQACRDVWKAVLDGCIKFEKYW